MEALSNDERSRAIKFLDDLRALTIKYQISIGGCGCCGSPFLDFHPDLSDPENSGYSWNEFDINENIKWISPGDEYYYSKFWTHIVRDE